MTYNDSLMTYLDRTSCHFMINGKQNIHTKMRGCQTLVGAVGG